MATALAEADDVVRMAWERIRIEPQKWRCKLSVYSGDEFWAVAVTGNQVIWFNDIEDGFNTSPFQTRGVIDVVSFTQSRFSEILNALPEALSAEVFARAGASSAVPPALRGPGTIVRRQTTYWVTQPNAGPMARVHFSGKRESRFVEVDYASAEISGKHPLLRDYQEAWSNLYVSNAQRASVDAFERVQACVSESSEGWRRFEEYGAGAQIFQAGHGLFMCAPVSLIREVAEVVSRCGATVSVTSEWKEKGSGEDVRVLLFGQSFVVADAFRFEF
ncbi:MAG: hypothetical protein K1X64_02635 [Myxococcaceae bacterium]|nr:hypothetical protein [Myxococcaceae bacterium]